MGKLPGVVVWAALLVDSAAGVAESTVAAISLSLAVVDCFVFSVVSARGH